VVVQLCVSTGCVEPMYMKQQLEVWHAGYEWAVLKGECVVPPKNSV